MSPNNVVNPVKEIVYTHTMFTQDYSRILKRSTTKKEVKLNIYNL